MERSPPAEPAATLAPRAAARYPSPVPTLAAGFPRTASRAIVFAAFAFLSVAPASAQRLFGAGADASVLKRGQARWTIGAEWTVYDELLDASGNRRPLGGRFSANLGGTSTSWLGVTELGVRAALQDNSAAVSAGQLRLREELQRTLLPLGFELGITPRLTISLFVPLSLTYVSSVADLNRENPSPANVALNPGLSVAASAAQATNVQTQANAAVASLQFTYPSCFAPGAPPSCASTIALASNTSALGSGVVAAYGPTARFAPIAGSALQAQVLARFATLNTQLRAALGLSSDPITARPVPAPVRMALNDLNTFLFSPAFGMNADTLTSLERTALGDAELGARYLWVDGISAPPGDSARARGGPRFRSTAFVTVRLPTAPPPYLGQLLDPGAGEAATAIEWRSTTDVAVGENFWISVTGRYGMTLSDLVKRRVPSVTSQLLIPSNQVMEISRKPGDYAEVEAIPRWMFNDYFAVSADYVLFLKRGDRYEFPSGTGSPAVVGFPQPALLNTGHQTAQRIGVGFTYSTLASSARGKGHIPLEIRYQRLQTVGGEGTPFATQDRLEFRLYSNLYGRR